MWRASEESRVRCTKVSFILISIRWCDVYLTTIPLAGSALLLYQTAAAAAQDSTRSLSPWVNLSPDLKFLLRDVLFTDTAGPAFKIEREREM